MGKVYHGQRREIRAAFLNRAPFPQQPRANSRPSQWALEEAHGALLALGTAGTRCPPSWALWRRRHTELHTATGICQPWAPPAFSTTQQSAEILGLPAQTWTGHMDRNEECSWMLSQTQCFSIINLHTVNRSHKLWELLLPMSSARNCSNASFTSSPGMSAPRASLPGDGTWQGGLQQSPLPPCSCPRQQLGTQTRGTSRGKNDPRGCTGIAGWCL